jgi:hypothetical protein
MHVLDRRTFLRGLGGVSIGLPLLASMSASGHALAGPKRLVFFFSGNGSIIDRFATGTENDFALGESLAPLEPYKSDLLLLRGIDLESSFYGPGDNAHSRCMPHLLTGTEMIPTGGGNLSEEAGGPSVDQYIAQNLDAGTKFGSLGFGISTVSEHGANPFNVLSYSGPAQKVPTEDDPQAAFDRVFSDLLQTGGELDVLRARRHSVLDTVLGETTRLRARLPTDDRARLDQHLDALREVERSIDVNTSLGGACEIPDPSAAIDGAIHEAQNLPTIGDAMARLTAMSLACDLTRVAVLQYGGALGGVSHFPFLGIDDAWHDNLSHAGYSNVDAWNKMTTIHAWYAGKLAEFLDMLVAMPEGTGTVYDNTLVVWLNELSEGNAHSRRNMHYVLAGGAAGHFRMGRLLEYPGTPHNNLLVSLANYMDQPIDTFGNPAFCTGPLANLL